MPSVDPPDVLARVHEGLPIVATLARHLKREFGGSVEVDDLDAWGREALVHAARSYDPARGVPFRAWATLRARGAMIDGMRSSGRVPRRLYKLVRAYEGAQALRSAAEEDGPAAPANVTADALDERLGLALATAATAMAMRLVGESSGLMEAEGAPDPAPSAEEQLAHAEVRERVRSLVATLPESERHLVERHYYGDVTLEEAAREIGLSKSWGSRLHARALETLTKAWQRQGDGGGTAR